MKKAILSVDDERIILESLKFQLTKHFQNEFLLEFAESGIEALEIVDELINDDIELLLIISDYLIPKMDGEELIKIIKNKYPKINVVMLTGQANSTVINELLNSGLLNEVILKPWSEEQLIKIIKTYT
jgi:CheY-like chemotaxis protein